MKLRARASDLHRQLGMRPVLPGAVVLVLVWVGLQRLFWLMVVARFHPNPSHLVNVGQATAYWELLQGSVGWSGTLQSGLMIVNGLLALYLWTCLRGLPRGAFADRGQQLLAYGGAAALLAYLQYALLKASLVEPAYRLMRLPSWTFG